MHVTPQAITGWVGRAGYPQPAKASERRGQAHLWRYSDVLRWMADGKSKQPAGPGMDERESRRRKLSAEAKLAEMVYEDKSGKLIDRQLVIDQYSQMVIAARTRFLEIPSKLAPEVAVEGDPVVCQALMDQAITEALEELGNYGSKTPA